MKNPKIVFVLGAGASEEAGLPLGSKLRDEIRKNLNFEFDSFGRHESTSGILEIYQCLEKLSESNGHVMNPDNPYILAADRIRDGVAGAYREGYDVIRGRRVARAKKLGILPAHIEMEDFRRSSEPWDTLDDSVRADF